MANTPFTYKRWLHHSNQIVFFSEQFLRTIYSLFCSLGVYQTQVRYADEVYATSVNQTYTW